MKTAAVAITLAVLLAAGCKEAPPIPEVEATARTVKVGDVAVSLRLPKDAEQDQTSSSESRFMVPGRGGASVILGYASKPDLAEETRVAGEMPGADGTKPKVVRSEEKGGRTTVTTVGANAVKVSVKIPLEKPRGSTTHLSCWAAFIRSKPLADPEATRAALETVCDSLSEVP